MARTTADDSTGPRPIRVLFVCTGNICRSPTAEGVFAHLAAERGAGERFVVDSAGTGGWHIGSLPDPRTRAVAEARGVPLTSRARQLEPARDFPDPATDPRGRGFDHLIAADLDHVDHMVRLGGPRERISLLRAHDPALHGRPEVELETPDPYYGDDAGFERCYDVIEQACLGLLNTLLDSVDAR
ncbi:MAG: low molecular weight protein-tyrosine-phosphatase [Planctomycetota bacterium]